MFKAKKTRPILSQKTQSQSTQSSNTENESENLPLGQKIVSQNQEKQDDEDVFIPPSQETNLSVRSQRSDRRRFLSQRSHIRYTNSLSQISQRNNVKLPKSYFEEVLLKTGVKIEDDYYVLNSDVYRFQNVFDHALRTSDNYPENLKVLASDIKTLINKSEADWLKLMTSIYFSFLKEADESTQEHAEHEHEIHESIDYSMLRILLMNSSIQLDMYKIVFEELRKRCKAETDAELQEFALVVRQMLFVNFRNHEDYIFKEYFEILQACNTKTRDFFIGAIDDLIDDDKQTAAVEKILTLITDMNELFTVKNLETFGRLVLDSSMLNKLRTKIIQYIKNGAPKQHLCNLLRFMLRYNEDEIPMFYEVINDIRNCIIWNMDDIEVRNQIYDLIQRFLVCSEVMRKSWLKAIDYVTNPRDHKIIDPIACFIIGMQEHRYNMIESVFKRRVKEKLFTTELIQQMGRQVPDLLTEYVQVMTDVFDACFRERDPYSAFFGAIGFRVLFKIKDGDRRYPLHTLISMACTRPSDVPFLADNDIRTNALELLLEIKRKLKSESDGGFSQIEKILDRSSTLSIDQYRIVIKILCSLAYDGQGNDKIKSDLEIMAPKNFTNFHLRSKLQGIVIVFQILNHTMWTKTPDEESFNFSNDSSSTISLSQIPIDGDLNNGKLLRNALKASQRSLDALMLYYDELGSIVSSRNKDMEYKINAKFQAWLHDQILTSVQNTFVVDEVPPADPDLSEPLDYLFNINTTTDNDSEEINTDAISIGINIAGIILKATASTLATSSIQLLCPMFNALAMMTYRRYNAQLEAINALLGCALLLPRSFTDEDKLVETYANVALDMYFHVANWFRCVISAFASQRDRSMRKKVLKRINQLIEIEASVKYLLQKCDANYDPPQTTYQIREDFKFIKPIGVAKRARKNGSESDSDENPDENDDEQPGPSKKKRKSKKKSKDPELPENVITQFDEESMNLNLNATVGNLPVQTQFNINTQGTQSAEVVKHKAKYWFNYGLKEKYRQLDMDLMLLLEDDLEIVYPVPDQDMGKCLHLQELKFILADLVSKTESIAGVKKFYSEQQTQNLASATDYIHDLVLALKHIIKFKKQLSAFLQGKLTEMDTDDTVERFSDETNHAKICFGSCLHLLAALFSWPGFHIDDNHGLLRVAMNSILEPSVFDEEEPLEESEIEELAEKTLTKITNDASTVMDIRSAVHLLYLVKVLSVFADKPEAVVDLAEQLLAREWYALDGTKENTKSGNVFLTEILKCFTRDMELPKLEEVVNVFSEEMITLKTKHDWMKSYPNFNRRNCTIFYRVIASTCEKSIKRCIETIVHTKDLHDSWKTCFDVLRVLLITNEKNPILQNTVTFLRYSHSIMKVFRKSGIKVMEKMVHRNQQAVQDMLKSMQKTSRFLHSLSCDTKARSNSRVLKQLPALRETMEKLVVEIKSTLAQNHALSSFWLANLSNKNLQGEMMLSQIENTQNEDDEDGDDDDDVEDDLDSPDNSELEDDKSDDKSDEKDDDGTVSSPSVLSSRTSKVFD
uniref:CSON002518 protein n=1 Tax=Culicoides sonorensis TaxID=179676 RepID=A0A336LSA1_CULSO